MHGGRDAIPRVCAEQIARSAASLSEKTMLVLQRSFALAGRSPSPLALAHAILPLSLLVGSKHGLRVRVYSLNEGVHERWIFLAREPFPEVCDQPGGAKLV